VSVPQTGKRVNPRIRRFLTIVSSRLVSSKPFDSQISVTQMKREMQSTFHCMVHGDLFELAEPKWTAENEPESLSAGASGSGSGAGAAGADDPEEVKSTYLPAAPQGLVYRQVNQLHSEVMCDIFGRWAQRECIPLPPPLC
jgi:hypothetical protein